MELFDKPDESRLLAALESYDAGDYATAEHALTPLAAEGNVTAIFKYANTLDHLGRTSEAVPWWRIASNFGHAGSMNNLALDLMENGQPEDVEEAERLYVRSLEAGNLEAGSNLAGLLEDRGDIDEFEALLECIGDSGWPRAYARWGSYHLEVGDSESIEKSIAIFSKGIPAGNAACHAGMAFIAHSKGDWGDVCEWAQRALECTFDSHEIDTGLPGQLHGLLGSAYLKFADHESALLHLEEAHRLGALDLKEVLHLRSLTELKDNLQLHSLTEWNEVLRLRSLTKRAAKEQAVNTNRGPIMPTYRVIFQSWDGYAKEYEAEDEHAAEEMWGKDVERWDGDLLDSSIEILSIEKVDD